MILVRGWYRAATISDLIYSLDRNSFVREKWNPLRQLWETTILLIGCQTFVCHLGNPIIQNPLYTILFKVTHLFLEYFIHYFGFKRLRKCFHVLEVLGVHQDSKEVGTLACIFAHFQKKVTFYVLGGIPKRLRFEWTPHVVWAQHPHLFLLHVKEF